jgi:hypothetical protein
VFLSEAVGETTAIGTPSGYTVLTRFAQLRGRLRSSGSRALDGFI